MNNWRFTFIITVFFLIMAGVWARLVYWQVFAADDLRQQAADQRLTIVEMPGTRGEILASDGFPLAANRLNYLLWANPKQNVWNSKWDEISRLLPASDSAKLSEKLSWTNLSWVALSSQISPQIKDLIEKMDLEGVGFDPRPVRFYPEGSSSAHLLGFVGQDAGGTAKGYFGLEGYYDRKLAGRGGKVILETDAFGHPIVISGQNLFPAVDGQQVQTSIDRTLQFILANQLTTGLAKYQAKSGTITVMEPFSGRVLAMVSLPNYDPDHYQQVDDAQVYKNPVVSEFYEPGSTFKVVTMASALDAGVVTPDTKCPICKGPVPVAEYTIRTWNDKYFPDSTLTDVIVHSDNVGMVYVSQKLGRDTQLEYLHRFGLGAPTGIDLQDETSPVFRPDRNWTEVDLATTAFGQGIAVTPIQMLRSVAAIAAGGKLPNPKLGADGGESQRVVSETAAAQVTQMMIKAVENGEAKWAKPAGYTIAGKTGTAQIPVAGHYDKDQTIASFVGFAPAFSPQFVMLVTLNQPQTSPWGSETAAPLWFSVARELFRYYKIGPDR
ncbi:MAG: penicillin-binding protein 2 [bacterium]|nr:penicillin-binding protein 2 [bacterium]